MHSTTEKTQIPKRCHFVGPTHMNWYRSPVIKV